MGIIWKTSKFCVHLTTSGVERTSEYEDPIYRKSSFIQGQEGDLLVCLKISKFIFCPEFSGMKFLRVSTVANAICYITTCYITNKTARAILRNTECFSIRLIYAKIFLFGEEKIFSVRLPVLRCSS